jgi:beta-mannosidase
VAQAVRRLRHRACLALWCGNNEVEQAWAGWEGFDTPENADLKAGYQRFFHHQLPEWVAADDPDTPYWPSSPSSNTPFVDPNGGDAGDIHQWAVWHGLKPFRHYRETPARFVSEFGFQSLPALATVATYAEPADWNMTSYVMEHHQRNPGGNGRIIAYLADRFRLPGGFAALVYLTQILQAEAIRIGVEHWRRDPACSGTLYWQLNDCWPVASWASLDYYGRWKALHYASRRFFAPRLFSIEEEGPRLSLWLTNDTGQAWAGEARWRLETLAGEPLASGAVAAECAPWASARIAALDLSEQVNEENRRVVVFVCEWREGEARRQMAVAAFVPDKHLRLEEPGIEAEVQANGAGLLIRLRARSLARFVELALEGAEVVFGDNYFDLPAGREAAITCPLPEGWAVEQARAALRVRSLVESY